MGLRDRKFYHDKNIFFITTTCYEWKHLLSIGDSRQIVVESLQFCANKYKSSILGYVVMPNHLHMIKHFEEGSKRIDFMRDFKKFTSTKIRQQIELNQPDLLEKILYLKDGQTFKVWQDRFDEVYVESKALIETKLQYIHSNPLQEHWNLCIIPEDYIYSSAGFYEKGENGILEVKHYMDFI